MNAVTVLCCFNDQILGLALKSLTLLLKLVLQELLVGLIQFLYIFPNVGKIIFRNIEVSRQLTIKSLLCETRKVLSISPHYYSISTIQEHILFFGCMKGGCWGDPEHIKNELNSILSNLWMSNARTSSKFLLAKSLLYLGIKPLTFCPNPLIAIFSFCQ